MRQTFNFCLLALLLIVTFSCKKSSSEPPAPVPDTTGPTISLVDPTAGKSFVLGTPLHLQMNLSDNVELKSYKVAIVKSLKGIQTTDWGFSQTWTIAAGKSASVNHNEIVVPTTVAGNPTTIGNYDLTVTCTDAAGNATSTSVVIALTK